MKLNHYTLKFSLNLIKNRLDELDNMQSSWYDAERIALCQTYDLLHNISEGNIKLDTKLEELAEARGPYWFMH